jgi:hypothetical protein
LLFLHTLQADGCYSLRLKNVSSWTTKIIGCGLYSSCSDHNKSDRGVERKGESRPSHSAGLADFESKNHQWTAHILVRRKQVPQY